MKLKKIISILEDCHARLHYFCEDADNTAWYTEAREQLKHTIKFMERHLSQQSSAKEPSVQVDAENQCIYCRHWFEAGHTKCGNCGCEKGL